MKRRGSLLLHLTQLRILLRKFALAMLFVISLVLMLMSKNQSLLIGYADNAATNMAAPVVSLLVWPAKIITKTYEYFDELLHIKDDNRVLRQENDDLRKLQDKYNFLEVENKLLRDLLNYVPLPELDYVSAKLVAEENGGLSHSMTIYVGDKMVNKGDVVLSDKGVIGRIDKKLQNYAKVVLLTDINSNIPVIVEKSRVRGILKGDNTANPKLVFLPIDAEITVGDRIVTSGVSGVFPAGLPIGYVASVSKSEIKVKPFASLEKLEYVRIVNYNIGGLLEEDGDDRQ